MRQLILDLLPEIAPTLDNYVSGRNGEVLAALRDWLTKAPPSSSFCLWGEVGAGKSHLLHATGFVYLDAERDPNLAGQAATPPQLAVDNTDHLSPQGQISLFNHFNRLRQQGGLLVTAGLQAPAHLALREDLRTRLGSGLIYRLQPLSDAEKIEALGALAARRHLTATPEMLDYLLRHAPRDMSTLAALVVALDRYSLEHQRPLTMPLLREVLASPPEL
jgi:DnaA-homolog protein